MRAIAAVVTGTAIVAGAAAAALTVLGLTGGGADGPLPEGTTAVDLPSVVDTPDEEGTAAPEPVVYLAAERRGRGDGTAPEHAARFPDLDDLIAERPVAGLEVRILGDAGPIVTDGPVPLRRGGEEGAPLVIRGWPPTRERPVIAGLRADPWTRGAEKGGEVLRLLGGADHIRIEHIALRDVGTAIRVAEDITDLAVEDVVARNVRRFLDGDATRERGTASITGLVVRDVRIEGFSKTAFRIRYDSSDVLLEDVVGDSMRQDGDEFAVGVQLDDTAHDVVLRRVRMDNSHDSSGQYWNGDGFSVERGVHDVVFDETSASGSTDAGYDLKGRAIAMRDVHASGNKRNYRFWGQVDVAGCEGRDPLKRGGSGTQAQVHIAERADVRLEGCTFADASEETIVFDLDGPNGALVVRDVQVTRAPGSQLVTEEPSTTFSSEGLDDVAGG